MVIIRFPMTFMCMSVCLCVPCCIWSLAALGSCRPGPPGSLTFELRCGPAPSNVARCRGANKQADLWRFVCWFNHSTCQWFGYIVTTSIIYMVMRSWCQWLWYIVISLQDLKRHGCVCFHLPTFSDHPVGPGVSGWHSMCFGRAAPRSAYSEDPWS
jgi:hypothetical protein